jgi:transcriptional regulator GlxA family with amidase domain
MKNIYVFIYENVVPSAAISPIDIFSRTNATLRAAAKEPAFNVQLISDKYKNVVLNEAVQFVCHRTLAELPPEEIGGSDSLIVVPAFAGEWELVLEKNRAVVPWLAAHHRAGTEVASLCLGSYFLAEAGLLDGKPSTTHWRAVDDMRKRFPNVLLQPDSVVTDQSGIYTGGGAFSSLNLILYLVEKFCGHEIGIQVSKNFSIHRDHISQAHFSVFRGLSQHGDDVVLQAQRFIESHYDRDFSVEDVAARVNMSKRNFIRRFKQATANTPLEYIQKVKVEAVKKALETGRQSVQALMHAVGYNDSKTFRDTFKRITGVTPQAYRNKYGSLHSRE